LRYGVGILLRRDAVDTVTVCAYLFKGKFAVRFSLHRCRLLLLSVQSVFYWFSTGGPKGKVVVWHIRAGGSGHGAPPKACKSRSGVAYPRWRFWSWCPTQGLARFLVPSSYSTSHVVSETTSSDDGQSGARGSVNPKTIGSERRSGVDTPWFSTGLLCGRHVHRGLAHFYFAPPLLCGSRGAFTLLYSAASSCLGSDGVGFLLRFFSATFYSAEFPHSHLGVLGFLCVILHCVKVVDCD